MRNFVPKFGIVISLLFTGSPIQAQETKSCPLTFEELVLRNWCELEQIYRQAKPGAMPTGFARGKVIVCPSEPFASCKEQMASLLWKGKIFCSADGTLVNQWLAVRAIHARVFLGESWLDGQPAIIFDYEGSSRVWNDVRDETREVAPGLYLGAMYRRRCPCPQLKVFFVLDTNNCCGK